VRLTREQADTARMLGMTEQEYAKNMLALQKEGKLGN
jgi:phage I-like protein